MSKKLWISATLGASLLTLSVPAHALVLGTEVTINDQDPIYAGTATNEDNEAEPGMVQSQVWDLEGFFLEGTTLSMVGGYNYWSGQASGSGNGGTDGDGIFSSGDLFLSVGKPLFGASDVANGAANGNVVESNSYGYDYVFDLDFDTNAWSLYAIDESTDVVTSYYRQNYQSNPWQFEATSGMQSLASGSIFGSESQTYSDAETGKSSWNGGTHYVAGLDLTALYAQLSGDETLFAHFTMECGNDNLMGSWEYTDVPEPATFALFTMGLGGLYLSRRKTKKAAKTA
ncbi:PEP-CTERM sorting domain-containing protein [Reinekea sp. G2M2-21]|uniref:PEP-CTERM sorting domain-containing protein n=1 Tax=Reinekea sp. G2M2-21 TaxID=2788942 RepID=UPI0018A90322|nr:PEP-CTERM sorting domain-containing protein [Reinekea sp. G2M2-21]